MFERIDLAPRIVAAAAIALVALLLLELIAVFAYDESPSARNAFGYDADAGITVGDGTVAIEPASSRRFWPQQYPVTPPPSVARIIVIGDSAVRGASLKESMTEELRRLLETRCGILAEVWNLSSPGYGSRRKALVAHKALTFAPDLIVYHAGTTTEYEDERERERFLEYHSWHPRHWIDQLPFLGRARLAKVERGYWELLPAEMRAGANNALDARLSALASKQNVAFWMPRMLGNLDRTVDEITRAKTPMLVVSQVPYDAGSGRMVDSGLDEALADRYAGNTGVSVVSTRRAFGAQPEPSRFFVDSSHWSDLGRDVLAGELADRIALMLHPGRGCGAPPTQAVRRGAPRLMGS